MGAVQLEVPLSGRQLVLQHPPGLVGLGLSATLEGLLEAPPLLDRLVEPGLQRLQLSIAAGELGLQLQLALLSLSVLVAEVTHQLLGAVKLGTEAQQLLALARVRYLVQALLGRLHLGGERPGLRILVRAEVLGGEQQGVGVQDLRFRCALRDAGRAGELDHRRSLLLGGEP